MAVLSLGISHKKNLKIMDYLDFLDYGSIMAVYDWITTMTVQLTSFLVS